MGWGVIQTKRWLSSLAYLEFFLASLRFGTKCIDIGSAAYRRAYVMAVKFFQSVIMRADSATFFRLVERTALALVWTIR